MSSTATAIKITKATPVSLREAGINEAWLEDLIVKEPDILRLGDVTVRDKQRQQEKAGRLDLLLEDEDEEKRYEVELMLGPTDESHLIRTIEYWDIERRKWPGYEHCAVLIAEDITSRFLNVISLFSGSIPIVALQVSALKVEEKLVINFFKVLDSRKLRKDDSTELKAKDADREYWVSRASTTTVDLADKCLEIINEFAKSRRTLNYKKYFIGLHDGVRSGNFVTFRPKKSFLKIRFESLSNIEPWVKRLEDSDLEFDSKNDEIEIIMPPKDFQENKQFLTEMFGEAVKDYETN